MSFSHRRHDISDAVWSKLADHLPGSKGKVGRPWRDLPSDYGNWNNIHRRFSRWRDKNIWSKLLKILIDNPEFEWFMIDASHMAHFHAAREQGGNHDMNCIKGGTAQSFIWPWIQMVCPSDFLSQKAQNLTIKKLKI